MSELSYAVLSIGLITGCSLSAAPPDAANIPGTLAEDPQLEKNWSPYLDSSWPTIHGDPFNSDTTSVDFGTSFAESWHNPLGTAAVLVFLTIDDGHDRIYAATGKVGAPALYALNRAGQVAWSSADWSAQIATREPGGDPSTLGTCAATSDVIIDRDGDVYITDCKYMWAAHADGVYKWRTLLPVESDGRQLPFVTAFFTGGGDNDLVGGVNAGGRVLLFDRSNGTMVGNQMLRGLMRKSVTRPSATTKVLEECVWQTDDPNSPMLDPSLIDTYVAGFLGVGSPVVNTPAVYPDSDTRSRIYVPGILQKKNADGTPWVRLYRIDVVREGGSVQIIENPDGFDGTIPGGLGSATSPDISPDGRTVYMGDNQGFIRAFDAFTGVQLWATKVGALYGSFATTRGGARTIYAATSANITALSPDGVLLWAKDYSAELTAGAQSLKDCPAGTRAMPNGTVITSSSHIIVPFVLGCQLGQDQELGIWVMSSLLVTLDLDGKIVSTFPLKDSAETSAIPDRFGNVFIAHGSALSSTATCLKKKYPNATKNLPQPLAPLGGVTAVRAF